MTISKLNTEKNIYDNFPHRVKLNNNKNKLLISKQDIWEKYFAPYEVSRFMRANCFNYAIKQIPLDNLKGKIILDYACGTGWVGVFLALHGAYVYGFDISSKSVELAKERAKINGVEENATFQVMSASNLEFYESDMFDYCIGIGALHHVIKYPNIGKELSRVMKRNSISVFAENLGENQIINLIHWLIWKNKGIQDVEHMLSYREYREVGKYFTSYTIKEISLLFSVKRLFGHITKSNVAFSILKKIEKLDEKLLVRFPILKKYCSEAVAIFQK